MKKNTPPDVSQMSFLKLSNTVFREFTHSDYKVFLYLIGKIEETNPNGKYLKPDQIEREYTLTANEFSEMFNICMSTCYGILKQAGYKLLKTHTQSINFCSGICYNNGSLKVKFTDHIMPYLVQIKQRFALYDLKQIADFGSLYTTLLYELIQEFKETGWIRKSVEQLREIFAVGDKLKEYKDFKKRTFEHACKEINKIYDYGLTFEEFKKGRKIVAIEFSFKKGRKISLKPNISLVNITPTKTDLSLLVEQMEKTICYIKSAFNLK